MRSLLVCVSTLLLSLTLAAHSASTCHTLIISEGDLWTDGNPRAKAVLINGTFPGPTLRFRVGESVVVRVINHLPRANTTMHFHGLSQSLVPASDGTGMVSQWPIVPGNYYDYKLKIGHRDAGTTFYHAHVGLQATSAFAAVIVEDDPPTLPSEHEDVVMAVSDYFYQPDEVMESGLEASPFVWPGSAKSIVLNGAAWAAPGACNTTLAASMGVDCGRSTYSGPTIIDVNFQKSYRMRWIGAQSLIHLAIGIFGHQQDIIAVDGTLIKPVGTEYIELLGGQRYDTHLGTKSRSEVAKDNSKGCYPIRFETRWRAPKTNGWAMLRYPGAQCNISAFSPYPFNNTHAHFPPPVDFWISDQFHPYYDHDREPADGEVTRRVYIHAQQIPAFVNSTAVKWANNGLFYNENAPVMGNGRMTTKPYLMQLYAGETEAPSYERAMRPGPGQQKGFDSLANVFVAGKGEVVDVVIINNGSQKTKLTETHPWHFHGPDHHSVAMGLGNFTEDKFRQARQLFHDSVARDTTAVWPGMGAADALPPVPLPANSSGSWSVLRIKVPTDGTGSGVWMLHCHWGFHLVMGMSTLWAFAPDDIMTYSLGMYSDPNYLLFGRNVTA